MVSYNNNISGKHDNKFGFVICMMLFICYFLCSCYNIKYADVLYVVYYLENTIFVLNIHLKLKT